MSVEDHRIVARKGYRTGLGTRRRPAHTFTLHRSSCFYLTKATVNVSPAPETPNPFTFACHVCKPDARFASPVKDR